MNRLKLKDAFLKNSRNHTVSLTMTIDEYNSIVDVISENEELSENVNDLKQTVMNLNFSDWTFDKYWQDPEMLDYTSYKYPFDLKVLIEAGISFDEARSFIENKIEWKKAENIQGQVIDVEFVAEGEQVDAVA